jgi:hypothetical protein
LEVFVCLCTSRYMERFLLSMFHSGFTTKGKSPCRILCINCNYGNMFRHRMFSSHRHHILYTFSSTLNICRAAAAAALLSPLCYVLCYDKLSRTCVSSATLFDTALLLCEKKKTESGVFVPTTELNSQNFYELNVTHD